MELFHSIMFRDDNTEGYTAAQLDALNDRLAARIRFIAEWDVETAHEIAKAFADEVAGEAA